jgi:hypothetical protein
MSAGGTPDSRTKYTSRSKVLFQFPISDGWSAERPGRSDFTAVLCISSILSLLLRCGAASPDSRALHAPGDLGTESGSVIRQFIVVPRKLWPRPVIDLRVSLVAWQSGIRESLSRYIFELSRSQWISSVAYEALVLDADPWPASYPVRRVDVGVRDIQCLWAPTHKCAHPNHRVKGWIAVVTSGDMCGSNLSPRSLGTASSNKCAAPRRTVPGLIAIGRGDGASEATPSANATCVLSPTGH